MVAYCQLCGQKIGGRGQEFHHSLWPPDVVLRVCAQCARERPRCQVCDIPVQTAGLCVTCSASLQVCLACSRPIKGEPQTFDSDGQSVGPYCSECFRSRPPCDVCGAPLTHEYWELSDGRVICAGCHASAVYSPEAAAALYARLKEVIVGDLGLALNIPTGLALVDRNQLRQVIEQQSGLRTPDPMAQTSPAAQSGSAADPELDANHTLGLYARRGMRRGIYIQTGLPRLLFLQIAAHEYAHAWQGENCPMLRDPRIHEGFAEWVAYRAIGHYGDDRGQERMLSRQDIYGKGLRWALDMETRRGAQRVIDACRRPQEL